MGMNPYVALSISEIGNIETPALETADLFQVMGYIAASDRGHTISIRQAGAEIDEEIIPAIMPISDDFSLWARYGARWRFVVIGAVSIDDVFFELVETLQAGKADEIRLCTPGCPQPRAL